MKLLASLNYGVAISSQQKQISEATQTPIISKPLFVTEEPVNATLFVMMPFAEQLRWVFDTVIAPLGEELGLLVSRVDEESFAGPITDRIEKRMVSSRVLIADITDNNPNVIYELGLAHGRFLRDKTILISQDVAKIPFDIKDYVVIEYGTPKSAVNLRDKLRNAILSVLGSKASKSWGSSIYDKTTIAPSHNHHNWYLLPSSNCRHYLAYHRPNHSNSIL